jgi:muramoyltetrapeptide carboxypeptidase
MSRRSAQLVKPKALRKGSKLAVVSPSSPADPATISEGIVELRRLGFVVDEPAPLSQEGYFAGGRKERLRQFQKSFREKSISGVVASRGGYGANYLIDLRMAKDLGGPKCLIGFSDLNIIQLLLLETRHWAGFYGPMAAAGFNHGANQPSGYDEVSFLQAVGETKGGWEISLRGESIRGGSAAGRLAGGCLTLLQTTLGTGFEPDTEGAILVLEDRGMKPYQVDRALQHLNQAGKFKKVSGFLIGDFPDCDSPAPGSLSIREICERILGPLKVPIVYGAPIGHTKRAMLTIPLGVRGKLQAKGEGMLEILEPAVVD